MNPIPTSEKATLARVAALLRPHGPAVAGALVSMTAASAGVLVLPMLVKGMLDHATGASPARPTVGQVGGMAAALVLLAAAAYVSSVLLHEVARKVCARLREESASRWLHASLAAHRNMPSGELSERLNVSLSDVDWFLKSSLGNMLGIAFLTAGSLFMLFWISWKLAVVTALVAPFAVLALQAIEKSGRKLLRRRRAEGEKLAGMLQGMILGLDVIKAFNAEERESARFNAQQRHMLAVQRSESFVAALVEPVLIATAAITFLFVIFAAGTFIASGAMTVAELVTFLAYLMFVLPNVRTLGLQLARWRHLKVALEFLDDTSRLAPERDARDARVLLRPTQGVIEFDAVRFTHPDRSDLLRGMTFRVEPGETTGIVGESGAGKSTIFQLLLRFYEPDSGYVRINGSNVAMCTRASLREACAYVPQDVVLFDGTLLDNLLMGNPNASEADVRKALAAAQALSFVENLPLGLATPAGDRGLKLSAGQRQRLAIARALLRDSPILLLDEATSALDPKTELLFGESLREMSRGRTTLVVAHRLSTVISLPRLLFVKDGVVQDDGTHAELMDRCASYRALAGMA